MVTNPYPSVTPEFTAMESPTPGTPLTARAIVRFQAFVLGCGLLFQGLLTSLTIYGTGTTESHMEVYNLKVYMRAALMVGYCIIPVVYVLIAIALKLNFRSFL